MKLIYLFLAAQVVMLAAACVATATGPRLTPDAEHGILAGEQALCDVVVGALWPPGVSACVGAEQLLQAALDKVTATPDAGAVGQSAAPPPTLVHTLRGYEVRWRGRLLGYALDRALAVRLHSPQVTVVLDALVADAGGGR